MRAMDFQTELQEKIKIIDNGLRKYLQQLEGKCPSKLLEAMEYSLFPGGKRLRPVLLLAVCEALGGHAADALPFACALEMIHTYSLIHDDLPAMDDDDIRRGKPSNHKVFGEDIAVLAGDGLLNFAYEIMTTHCIENNNTQFLKAQRKIAESAGVMGMVGGQVLDMALARGKTPDDVMDVYVKKTAKLFMAAFAAGAYIAGAADEVVENMEYNGKMLGISFQILDDFDDENLPPHLEILGIETSKKILKESLEAVELEDYSFLRALAQLMVRI